MSILNRLFGRGGGGEASAAEALEYKGFQVTPDPIPEGGKFRIGARIEKEIDGETRTHRLIRADLLDGREAAEEASIGKAKLMIDQLGERIFDQG